MSKKQTAKSLLPIGVILAVPFVTVGIYFAVTGPMPSPVPSQARRATDPIFHFDEAWVEVPGTSTALVRPSGPGVFYTTSGSDDSSSWIDRIPNAVVFSGRPSDDPTEGVVTILAAPLGSLRALEHSIIGTPSAVVEALTTLPLATGNPHWTWSGLDPNAEVHLEVLANREVFLIHWGFSCDDTGCAAQLVTTVDDAAGALPLNRYRSEAWPASTK